MRFRTIMIWIQLLLLQEYCYSGVKQGRGDAARMGGEEEGAAPFAASFWQSQRRNRVCKNPYCWVYRGEFKAKIKLLP